MFVVQHEVNAKDNWVTKAGDDVYLGLHLHEYSLLATVYALKLYLQ